MREEIMSESGAPELRAYDIDSGVFFRSLASYAPHHADTMTELIERYGIIGKKVLSVGPGDCAQEYWFHKLKNSLFLIDIDERGLLEPRLKKLAESKGSAADSDRITYVIGDAVHVSSWLNDKFDVIFTSGFTPDEFYRTHVQEGFRERVKDSNLLSTIGAWPPDAPALSPLTAEIIDRGLADDGLFILLSYRGGPGVIRARNYLPSMREQLQALGLHLLEVHCLASVPGVHLVIAQRSRDPEAIARRRTALMSMPPLKAIHARTPLNHTTIRLFPEPSAMGDADHSTLMTRLFGDKEARIRQFMEPIIGRFAPRAKSAYYAGAHLETECAYLLARGMLVDFGWPGEVGPMEQAVDRQLVHPSFLEQGEPRTYDLIYAGRMVPDEMGRLSAALSLLKRMPSFAPALWPFAAERLTKTGVVLYQGRTRGLNPLFSTSFVDRLVADVEASGLFVQEMYAMKSSPGIFTLAAGRQREIADPSIVATHIPAPGTLESTAVRLWPR